MKNSLLYWYPLIKDLGIKTPETEIVVLNKQSSELMGIMDGDWSSIEPQMPEIISAARKIGFPLFMRTDEYSGKHQWKNTCYVEKEEDLNSHIYDLFEGSFCADMMGLPIRALVFRKYIPMNNLFKAFYGEMPVNPEIRFFVKDGEVLCWHWYWVEEAIEQGTPKGMLPSDWKEIIKSKKEEISDNEILSLTNDARKIAQKLGGYWSVDFCQDKKGDWWIIDLAIGELSWHPDCDKKVKS